MPLAGRPRQQGARDWDQGQVPGQGVSVEAAACTHPHTRARSCGSRRDRCTHTSRAGYDSPGWGDSRARPGHTRPHLWETPLSLHLGSSNMTGTQMSPRRLPCRTRTQGLDPPTSQGASRKPVFGCTGNGALPTLAPPATSVPGYPASRACGFQGWISQAAGGRVSSASKERGPGGKRGGGSILSPRGAWVDPASVTP